jgi:hypothetical protein
MNARKVDPCGQGGTRPAANNAAEQGRACGGELCSSLNCSPSPLLHDNVHGGHKIEIPGELILKQAANEQISLEQC